MYESGQTIDIWKRRVKLRAVFPTETFNRAPSSLRHAAQKTAHHTPRIASLTDTAAWGLSVASGLLPASGPTITVAAAFLRYMAAVADVVTSQHLRTAFCEDCMDQRVTDYVHAAGEAKRTQLRIYHVVDSHRRVYLASSLAYALARHKLHNRARLPLLCVGGGFALIVRQATRIHLQLQPGCPWCGGNSGSEEAPQQPAPDAPAEPQPA